MLPLSHRILAVYFPLFILLSILQSIWQFSGIVLPLLLHGRIWSASISSMLNCFWHIGQIPFC